MYCVYNHSWDITGCLSALLDSGGLFLLFSEIIFIAFLCGRGKYLAASDAGRYVCL